MQNEKLDKIQIFYSKHNRIPTYKEMQKLFHDTPCTAIAWNVFKWKRDGILKEENYKLQPTSKFFGLPLLGNIKAGFPTEEDGYQERIKITEYLMENPDNSYFLKVSDGDLATAGINEGDIVIIDTTKSPKNGDIVGHRFGNEWVLSTFEAARPSAARISREDNQLMIQMRNNTEAGVVVSVIRKIR